MVSDFVTPDGGHGIPPVVLDVHRDAYHDDALGTHQPTPKSTPPILRFIDKVTLEANGCWTLDAHVSRSGYVIFVWHNADGKRQSSGHRFAYTYFVGEIPDGLVLDHLCRVRHCVNPGHLEPVTQRENILRGEGVAAINAAKTHCIHGHLLDDSCVRPDGTRACRTCHLIRSKARATGIHPLRDRTHCRHGHEFTVENTLRVENGWRKCRRCHADNERARRARKAA